MGPTGPTGPALADASYNELVSDISDISQNVADISSNYVQKTGDTMSGKLTVNIASSPPVTGIDISGDLIVRGDISSCNIIRALNIDLSSNVYNRSKVSSFVSFYPGSSYAIDASGIQAMIELRNPGTDGGGGQTDSAGNLYNRGAPVAISFTNNATESTTGVTWPHQYPSKWFTGLNRYQFYEIGYGQNFAESSHFMIMDPSGRLGINLDAMGGMAAGSAAPGRPSTTLDISGGFICRSASDITFEIDTVNNIVKIGDISGAAPTGGGKTTLNFYNDYSNNTAPVRIANTNKGCLALYSQNYTEKIENGNGSSIQITRDASWSELGAPSVLIGPDWIGGEGWLDSSLNHKPVQGNFVVQSIDISVNGVKRNSYFCFEEYFDNTDNIGTGISIWGNVITAQCGNRF